MSSITQNPDNTITYYVQMDEKDIHFLSSVIKGYDGIAHVRRDWIVREGYRWVKIMVPPGFDGEFQDVLDHASKFIRIGDARTDFEG